MQWRETRKNKNEKFHPTNQPSRFIMIITMIMMMMTKPNEPETSKLNEYMMVNTQTYTPSIYTFISFIIVRFIYYATAAKEKKIQFGNDNHHHHHHRYHHSSYKKNKVKQIPSFFILLYHGVLVCVLNHEF